MRKCFSENNFFGNTCSLISHIDIIEVKRWKGAVRALLFSLKLSSSQKKKERDMDAGNIL